MALLVLVVLNAVWGTGLSPTVLALPLIVLPYALLLLGLCWLLAALGVYLRDLTPVSYTHLDVYKRQAGHGTAGATIGQGDQGAIGAVGAAVHQVHAVIDTCLLYTSRCV